MPALSKDDKLRLLSIILESRHADLREQNLIRQGKGHFHVSGMGHEALAAVSIQMEPDDYIVSYYRDRGLVLGRGMTTRQLGLEYFAKRNTGSGGRQMPSHYSDADLHIWSVPTPTGSQLLPACGIAWGIKLDGKNNVVVTTIGDAATRQGDFFEAICFAKEKTLPMLFLVEDNAYGISMPTRKTNPLALDILEQDNWRPIEGQDVQQIYDATAAAFEKIRAGGGPFFFWIKMERLSSHTSSDDQKLYRTAEELQDLEKCDPLTFWKDQLIKEGVITQENYAELDNEIKERVRREYAEAEKAEDPSPNELLTNVTKPPPKIEKEILPPGKYRIGDTVNKTLRAGIEEDSQRILFGEDIEDPKGGVFRLTQKLSTEFPKQVFNSPLAESTILGVACGLAAYGKRPGVRAAIHRFHLSRLQSACDQHLDASVAILWELEMSGSDLCALWRVSARRQFVAQPGKRIGARALSRSERCDSKHACRRRRIALDGDACRGPCDFSCRQASALGRARIHEAN